jgi:hypothetical protein
MVSGRLPMLLSPPTRGLAKLGFPVTRPAESDGRPSYGNRSLAPARSLLNPREVAAHSGVTAISRLLRFVPVQPERDGGDEGAESPPHGADPAA